MGGRGQLTQPYQQGQALPGHKQRRDQLAQGARRKEKRPHGQKGEPPVARRAEVQNPETGHAGRGDRSQAKGKKAGAHSADLKNTLNAEKGWPREAEAAESCGRRPTSREEHHRRPRVACQQNTARGRGPCAPARRPPGGTSPATQGARGRRVTPGRNARGEARAGQCPGVRDAGKSTGVEGAGLAHAHYPGNKLREQA